MAATPQGPESVSQSRRQSFSATYDQLGAINDAVSLSAASELYIAMGWPVFPVRPRQKTPLINNGFHGASTDLETVRSWWTQWPTANIAVPILPGSAAVDVDDLEEAERLEEEHGARLTTGLGFLTGRGVQLLYRTMTEIRNSTSQLAPNIDIRGVGGYSVVPPSIHANGRQYQWWALQDDMSGILEPAPMPLWMAAKLTRRAPPPVTARRAVPTDHAPSEETFGEGGRNDGLTKIAGRLRRAGCDETTILITLETANRRRCSPPLDDREVQRIAASVSRYEPAGTPMPKAARAPLRFTASRDRRAS